MLAMETDVLLLEAPVCPVALCSTVVLAPADGGIAVLDAVTGFERARPRHALLLISEWRALATTYPDVAAHLSLVEWIPTSWDGDVALLRWEQAPERR